MSAHQQHQRSGISQFSRVSQLSNPSIVYSKRFIFRTGCSKYKYSSLCSPEFYPHPLPFSQQHRSDLRKLSTWSSFNTLCFFQWQRHYQFSTRSSCCFIQCCSDLHSRNRNFYHCYYHQ